MKVKVELECTPEEARSFLGLPDLTAFNAHVVETMRRQVDDGLMKLKPEDMIRNWMSLGGLAQDQFRAAMAAMTASALSGRSPPGGDHRE